MMKPEEPKNIPNLESRRRSRKWKRLLDQKWLFPAVYVVIAGVILSAAWWYQGYQFEKTSHLNNLQVVPTSLPAESIVMGSPVNPDSMASKTVSFYQEAASQKDKEAALVKYANTYWPHTGVDFARKDGKAFDVLAAADGKVLRVEENPIIGTQVEIQHADGLVSVYQSLSGVKVAKDQLVKKGEALAQSGRNAFEKELGIHLHFEVRKDKQTLNPDQYVR